MGHYSDSYEHDEQVAKEHRRKTNERAKKHIHDAMFIAITDHDKIFRQKLEEAIFWMEKET